MVKFNKRGDEESEVNITICFFIIYLTILLQNNWFMLVTELQKMEYNLSPPMKVVLKTLEEDAFSDLVCNV